MPWSRPVRVRIGMLLLVDIFHSALTISNMFMALFILCILVFGYLLYVLIKPEKF